METKFHFDQDSLTVENVQDVEGILENNKFLRNHASQPKTDGLKHIASIPNVVLVQWLNEEYMRGNIGLKMYSKEFDELVERKLNDPAWKYLRTDK
jgi:hypothetical protein